jgi:carbon-monoxide dehydrogenase medium subunit
VKAAPFDYVRPPSVASAVHHLEEASGDGKIIAGGQSLAPVLAMRLARPQVLVDINRIPGLSTISRSDDVLRIGALVRHHDLLEQHHSPLLAEAARWIGHAAIRSRGTTGGSIAHADPSAELPVVAAALDATIHAVGPGGRRTIAAVDLFEGALETSLEESEMIVGVDMPIPTTWGFAELSRRHGDFGLVTVVVAEVEGSWRVCVGGLAAVPFRARESESILDGGSVADGRVREAAQAAAAAITTSSDLHASADYRRAMAEEFTRRAIEQATAPSRAGVH